jgi:hypothetical protein
MKRIKLSNRNRYTIVDNDTYELLKDRKISIQNCGYAQLRWEGKTTSVHRIVMDADSSQCVHHWNGNKLDNRRENLGILPPEINKLLANTKRRKGKYSGVQDHFPYSWEARLIRNGVRWSSFHKTEEEAARAWDAKMRELYGEAFPYLNFPQL